MPNGMNGQQLLRKAREQRPTLKALFTSGYSEQFIRARDAVDQDISLIGKPYRRQASAEKIPAALDQAPSATGIENLRKHSFFRGLIQGRSEGQSTRSTLFSTAAQVAPALRAMNVSGLPSFGSTKMMSVGSRRVVSMDRNTTGSSDRSGIAWTAPRSKNKS